MRINSVATYIQADGRRLEVFATGNLFRYAVDVWMRWPDDHPVVESTTGYWSEQYESGLFESAETAMKDALASQFNSETHT